VLETKKTSTGRRRRHECDACGHRWTSYEGGPPGHRGGRKPGPQADKKPRQLEPAQIREILLSRETHRAMARKLGRCPETIRQVRLGKIHPHVHPEIARWDAPSPKPKPGDGPSCYGCAHWSERCAFGFPDPLIEGPAFAADCDLYAPA
jgi:hypothetical protein